MTKAIFEISMSLDGFVTAAGVRPEGGVYTFVTGGIERALVEAKAIAVMGGYRAAVHQGGAK